MPTYSAIGDTDIDAESPVTVTLMTSLRDNPLAIITGDPSAPDIVEAAHTDIAAGTTHFYGEIGWTEFTDTSNIYTRPTGDSWRPRIPILRTGIYTISWEAHGDGSGLVLTKVYANGAAASGATEKSTNSSAYVAFSDDIALNAGEYVEVWINPQNNNAAIRNVVLTASVPLLG